MSSTFKNINNGAKALANPGHAMITTIRVGTHILMGEYRWPQKFKRGF